MPARGVYLVGGTTATIGWCNSCNLGRIPKRVPLDTPRRTRSLTPNGLLARDNATFWGEIADSYMPTGKKQGHGSLSDAATGSASGASSSAGLWGPGPDPTRTNQSDPDPKSHRPAGSWNTRTSPAAANTPLTTSAKLIPAIAAASPARCRWRVSHPTSGARRQRVIEMQTSSGILDVFNS